MQAIVTKWLGPTNHRGSRIKVSCDALTRTYSWDYSKGVEENHAQAIAKHCARLGWAGTLVIGGAPDKGSPHAFVAVFVKRKAGGRYVFVRNGHDMHPIASEAVVAQAMRGAA